MKSSEKIPDAPDQSLRKGKEQEDESPEAEKDSKFEVPATGTGLYDCAQVINSFMKAQLPPHIKNAEIVKYAIMTLIDHVFDYMEDGVKDSIKNFISWVNTATGVTQQLDVGMCCAAAELAL